MSFIELKNVCKQYANTNKKAVTDFNLKIDEKEFIAFVGPSGCGKSTTLRMIAGFEDITSGELYIDGKKMNEVAPRDRGISMVFQNYALYPHMTVEKNISYGLKNMKVPADEIKRKVDWAIEILGLSEYRYRKPKNLSGGQRQRVAFARALAPNPQLLLLDEPFAAIDAKVRQELRSWLKEMIEKLGVTSIFVTHDQDEAIEVADEIIITNKGRVEQKGSPVEIYQNPQTAFAASFFGQTSLIENYTGFSTFDEIENAESAILRPEFVKITKKNEVQKYKTSAAEGVVERVSFRGNNIELTVRCKDNVFTARRGLDENPIEAGEKVDVFIYRMFVTAGDKAYLIENKALNEKSMII